METSDGAEGIDLRQMLLLLWARRWLVLASTIAGGLLATALALYMTPMYRASVVVVAASNERSGAGALGSAVSQLGGLASLAGIGIGSGDQQVQESLAVLRSRELGEGFIAEKKLAPVLLYKQWDSAIQSWRGSPNQQPTLAQAFKYLDGSVRTISRDRTTGLITVSMQWRDRDQAADWANELISRANEEMRSRAIASSSASLEYLQKELAATSEVETRLAINRLIETQINQRMLANVTTEYAFRVVDKALAPDPKDVSWPKKPLMVVAGVLAGFVTGVMVSLLIGAFAAEAGQRR